MASAAMDTQKSPQFAQAFRGHIPELDGLRAFGITMVIVAHMWPYPQGPHHEIWNLLHLSWILMDCFFVLSGFLIAGILLDSRSRSDYYRAFYTRRALRILPIYYVLIAVFTWGTVFHGVGDLYGNTALHKWASPWWYFIYLGNLPPAITGTTPTAARGAFGPLWSLQIEEQFYLLFPIFVHRLKLQTLARTLLCLVCLSPLLRIALYWLYPANTLVQYVLLPCRMEGLALGSLIAIRFRMGPWELSKRKLTLMAIVLIAITCVGAAWDGYVSTRPFNRTIGFLLSPIACSSVLLWLIRFRGSQLTACMRLSPLQHLAKISYAAYLFHWPIGAALVPISAALGVGALGHGYLKVVTVFMLTVILASLSWRFFEGPLFRLKERLSARQVSIARAGSLLT